MNRVFVNWDSNLLPAVIEILVNRYLNKADKELNLQNILIIFPTKRTIRRFIELLVLFAEQESITLIPPKTATPTALIDLFDIYPLSLANREEKLLTWIKVLKQSPAEVLCNLFSNKDNLEFADFLNLASSIEKIHEELTDECLSFIEAAELVRKLGFSDQRWDIFASLEPSYYNALKEQKLSDISEILHRVTYADNLPDEIFLIGICDLSKFYSAVIQNFSNITTAIIYAPNTYESHFDSCGSITKNKWLNENVLIPEETLEIHNSAIDETNGIIKDLNQLGVKYCKHEVTLCICDDELTRLTSLRLKRHDITTSIGAGIPIILTEIGKFIKTLRKYVKTQAFYDFGSLIRLPGIGKFIKEYRQNNQNTFKLEEIDEIFSQLLPSRAEELIQAIENPHLKQSLEEFHNQIKKFALNSYTLDTWNLQLDQLVRTLYGITDLHLWDPNEYYIANSCQQLLIKLNNIKQNSLLHETKLSGSEFLDLVLVILEDVEIPHFPVTNAINMVGWLDTVYDDSPALLLASFQDQYVPGSTTSDSILPNTLRSALGLRDNDYRLARDIFFLTALINSKENIKISLHRQSLDGSFVPASKLIFLDDPKIIASRIVAMDKQPIRNNFSKKIQKNREKSQMPLFQKFHGDLPLTSLDDYINCPFRFYLKHVLKLRSVDDSAIELNSSQFGSVIHKVLHVFHNSSLADSNDSSQIYNFLEKTLRQVKKELFAENHLSLVSINLQEALRRLHNFALWQCGRREKGWETIASELDVSYPIAGRILKGRIDRIDYNSKERKFALIDYKTSDKEKSPRSYHRKAENWISLQLPLYYHSFLGNEVSQTISFDSYELAFLSLNEDLDLSYNIAAWGEEDLNSALDKAVNAVIKINENIFWPPNEELQNYDEFFDICHGVVNGW